MKKIIFALALFLSFAVQAAGPVSSAAKNQWKDEKGKPVRQTDSMKSKNDFGAMLLVTADADYQQKWKTPSSNVPKFNTFSGQVKRGQKIWVLTFFSNPKLNAQKIADVRCDLKVVRPNGTVSVVNTDLPCLTPKPIDNPAQVFLSNHNLEFVAEDGDLSGRWNVFVSVVDRARNTRIDLKTFYVMK